MIKFIGSTNNKFGRGKDKKKRIRRLLIAASIMGGASIIGGAWARRVFQNGYINTLSNIARPGVKLTKQNLKSIRNNFKNVVPLKGGAKVAQNQYKKLGGEGFRRGAIDVGLPIGAGVSLGVTARQQYKDRYDKTIQGRIANVKKKSKQLLMRK